MKSPFKRFLLVCCAVAQTAGATDRWFDDVHAVSPNHRFTAAATSPENRARRPPPFAKNFTYTLTDTTAKRLLWSHFRPSNPARALFVSDSGVVISLDAYDDLTLFRPSGELIQLPGVFSFFSKCELKRYCDETSAGTLWSQFSWMDFYWSGRKQYFCICTYWGRMIVIDLEKGTICTSRGVHAAIAAQILTEARKIREIPPNLYLTYCPRCETMEVNPNIQKGIFVLVRHGDPGFNRFLNFIFSARNTGCADLKDYLLRIKPSYAKRYRKELAVKPG